MLRSNLIKAAFLVTSLSLATPATFAETGTLSREEANVFLALHQGRWIGKVQATIGEAEIKKVDDEALNYLDFEYLESNGFVSMRNYGPRSGGRGFTHYDAEKKIIRSINYGVGGVVTHHEIHPKDGAWFRTSKQILADGSSREFKSTIRFIDNNQTIKIEIRQNGDETEDSTQTNIWRRIQ